MEAAAFGTPAHLKSIHADLQLKWAAHSERVEELWRSFTPSHREAVFRAGVSQGKVLNDPHDQSLFQSYALYAEMNIRDISSSPRYFLDHFKHRATTDLIRQYNKGLKGGKGDCQLVRESVIVNNQILEQDSGTELMFFVSDDEYGAIYKAKSDDDYEQTLRFLASAVQVGIVVPRGIGELILERQSYIIQHLCVLADDILKLGSIIDQSASEHSAPEESAHTGLSIDADGQKQQSISFNDLLIAVMDRKSFFKAVWDLYSSGSDLLANAVKNQYFTRPELVPDEKGRYLPLTLDQDVSCATFEVVHNAVIGIAIWDVLCFLLELMLEPSEGINRDVISQEISNICHFEYERVRKVFKRSMQVGVGSKYFKRLSKVFDNGTPRVVMKPIPYRVMKGHPQLHYILRICQPQNGAAQAMQWNNMLVQLHHDQPVQREKLEQCELDALFQVSLTINLVNAMTELLDLPPASSKKGLTYISKLKELMARVEPLKAHMTLPGEPISFNDLKDPETARQALDSVRRFSEQHAGGSIVSLYQNLNKGFLKDLEIQLQEVSGSGKTETKCPSSQSVEVPHTTTHRQGFRADDAQYSESSPVQSSVDLLADLFGFDINPATGSGASGQQLAEDENLDVDAQLQLEADAQLFGDLDGYVQQTTTEDDVMTGPVPDTQLSAADIMEVLAELNLSSPESTYQSDIFGEYKTGGGGLETIPEEISEYQAAINTSPTTFKVSADTLQVFSKIFSALEESQLNSGFEPGPEYSIKWLDFVAAMNDVGFSILPSVSSMYTFVPRNKAPASHCLTVSRPYRSILQGDGLLLLAYRLVILFGWGKETFQAE